MPLKPQLPRININHRLYGIYYFRASLIRDPPLVLLPDVDSDPSWYPDVMLVYPTNEVITTHGGLVFKASCDLRIIMNRISFAIFGQKRGVDGRMIGRALSAAEIQAFCKELQTWYDNLPGPLTAEKIVLPAQMRLQ
jgi:hypothetical protein